MIIPAYNVESYIVRCLESISNQSLKDIEIILVDDGSTDKTLDLARTHAAHDARMTIITQENQYAGTARNKGLEIAQGDYLLFLDADDFFELVMFEKMYERATETDADTVICRSNYFDDGTQEVSALDFSLRFVDMERVYAGADLKDTLFRFCVGWPWDKLFKREFILAHDMQFQSLRTTNDAFFVFTAVALSERVSFVDESLVFHRTNNQNSLQFTRSRSWENAWKAIDAIGDRFQKEGLFPDFERAYLNWALNFLVWNYLTLPEEVQTPLLEQIETILLPKLPVSDPSFFFERKDYEAAQIIGMTRNQLVNRSLEQRQMREEINELKCRVDRQEELIVHLRFIESSRSYKVGRIITKLPRAIKAIIKRP